MATNALTCSASTLVSNNMASRSLLPVGLGRHPVLPPTPSSKAPSSRPSLVVKAQQGGGPNRIHAGEHIHKRVALVETSPYGHVKTLWSTTADENEINILFDTTEKGAENVKVDAEDDLLVIKGDGSKIFSPVETKLRLPFNADKKKIRAEFKNGMLYITVPKNTSDNQVKSD